MMQFNPDMAELMSWAQSAYGDSSTALNNINPDMFKNTTIKEWIAKDKMLPVRTIMDMTMEMTPADFTGEAAATTTPDFEKTTMTIHATIDYSDYNKPVTIELPAEAAGAKELNSAFSAQN